MSLVRSIVSGPLVDAEEVDGPFSGVTQDGMAPGERPADAALNLADLYRDHATKVALWARRLLGPAGDVEDALQEVFLIAHRRLHEYRGDAKITTWLHEITFRVTQNQRRKRRWARWLRFNPALEEGTADQRTPLHALESRRACELAYRILDTLPEGERTALILFEIDGLPADEISSVTGCTVGTVWVQLSRARQRLRKAFARVEGPSPLNQRRGGTP
ncbi:MAG TPA: sigma-70 family RNA polymerase sigma factor [Polyangiaceae bacterium]